MRETLSVQGSGVTLRRLRDIFLEELRKYREENLAKIGMKGISRLEKGSKESPFLHRCRFQGRSFTCSRFGVARQTLCGRVYQGVPLGTSPERRALRGNGEFHSFVSAGPIFTREIRYLRGDIVLRNDRFWYLDLIPCH